MPSSDSKDKENKNDVTIDYTSNSNNTVISAI